jgi:hypothetical protein
MDSDQSTRREFCRQCSVAGLAALRGTVLGACGGGSPRLERHQRPGAAAGQRQLGRRRDPGRDRRVFTCTHESCTITGFADSSYVCPCHGSRFDTSGRVLNGPASRALRQYQTQFANGVLTSRHELGAVPDRA